MSDPGTAPHGSRFRLLIRRFEGDPKTQYLYHKWSARFWLANAVIVTAVFFFAPPLWAKASVFYLVLISIYAAWATEFGAMAASEAAADEPVSAYSAEVEVTETPELVRAVRGARPEPRRPARGVRRLSWRGWRVASLPEPGLPGRDQDGLLAGVRPERVTSGHVRQLASLGPLSQRHQRGHQHRHTRRNWSTHAAQYPA